MSKTGNEIMREHAASIHADHERDDFDITCENEAGIEYEIDSLWTRIITCKDSDKLETFLERLREDFDFQSMHIFINNGYGAEITLSRMLFDFE